MRALGLLLALFSAYFYRAAFRGRAVNDLATDTADILKAFISGDTDTAYEAFEREGTLSWSGTDTTPVSQSAVSEEINSISDTTSLIPGVKTLAEMKRLGDLAKGYRLTATGPDYYDCSGLLYRAMKNLGYYDGIRFSTRTFVVAMGSRIERVDSPGIGIIILWPGHIAVGTSDTQNYGALSVKQGIKSTTNAALTKAKGTPRYYRLKAVSE